MRHHVRRLAGRPRMADVPETRRRNLRWLLLHTLGGQTCSALARASGVHEKTVRNGVAEARRDWGIDPSAVADGP